MIERMTAAQYSLTKPKRARRGQQEQNLQVLVVSSWQRKHPGVLLCGTPGGIRTSMSQAQKMKAAGYKKGWPDLVVLEPRRGFHGLLIELKAEGGQLRKEQRDTLSELGERGYLAVQCKGFAAAEAVRKWYMGSTETEPWEIRGVRRF